MQDQRSPGGKTKAADPLMTIARAVRPDTASTADKVAITTVPLRSGHRLRHGARRISAGRLAISTLWIPAGWVRPGQPLHATVAGPTMTGGSGIPHPSGRRHAT